MGVGVSGRVGRQVIVWAGAGIVCVMLGAAGPRATMVPQAPRATLVPLAPQPGGALDASARILARDDVAKAQAAGEIPLVLVGSAKLSAADRPALFVQLQSPHLCGSAGCSTSVFLWRAGVWSRVLDGVAGKLGVGAGRTRGMADIVSDETRYRWDGKGYRDVRPAPAVNLTPR